MRILLVTHPASSPPCQLWDESTRDSSCSFSAARRRNQLQRIQQCRARSIPVSCGIRCYVRGKIFFETSITSLRLPHSFHISHAVHPMDTMIHRLRYLTLLSLMQQLLCCLNDLCLSPFHFSLRDILSKLPRRDILHEQLVQLFVGPSSSFRLTEPEIDEAEDGKSCENKA
jgi:hypothetical protein